MKYPNRTRNLLFADYYSAVINNEAEAELGMELDLDTKLTKGIFNLKNFECAFDAGGGFSNIQLLGELYTLNISFTELSKILKEYFSDTDIFFNENKN